MTVTPKLTDEWNMAWQEWAMIILDLQLCLRQFRDQLDPRLARTMKAGIRLALTRHAPLRKAITIVTKQRRTSMRGKKE
jgi:hypothetical protein